MEIIKLPNGSFGKFFPVKEKELWPKKHNIYVYKASENYEIEIRSNKQTESLCLFYKQEKIFKFNAKAFYFAHFLGENPYLL